MSAPVRFQNNKAQEFSKEFYKLCSSRQRWQVWSDFVHLSAYTISNVVDKYHYDAREKAYLDIAKNYKKDELEIICRLLGITVMALEENPDQDFLGHLYMCLDLGNSGTGQFFTPYNVSKMMARMNFTIEGNLEPLSEKGYVVANDCCIGGGAMLIAFANACREKNVDYHSRVLFVAQDIDHTVACMAYIQLSLLGCPGYVVIDDSLTKPLTGDPLFAPMERETFITPLYISDVWHYRRMFHNMDAVMHSESVHVSDDIEPCQEDKVPVSAVATHNSNIKSELPEKKSEEIPAEAEKTVPQQTIQLSFYD